MILARLKTAARSLLGEQRYAIAARAYDEVIRAPIVRRRIRGRSDVSFYCQQPGHWQNVAGVVEHLLGTGRGGRVRLLTAYEPDEHDGSAYPVGLEVIHGVQPRLLRDLDTFVLYTPFVGLRWEDRPRAAKVIHTLVSLTSLDGVYAADMFDGYDYILCAGAHHIGDFRRWAEAHPPLRGKVMIPAGYPKFDRLLASADRHVRRPHGTATVVYAPTHVYSVNERLASLRRHGEAIVDQLLELGLNVVFRPHPVSFRDEDSALIARIERKYAGHPRLTIDRSKDYRSTYSNADAMVTDLSGTGFTFSLTYLRPSVFFCPDAGAEDGLLGIQFEDRDKLGGVARSLTELARLVGVACATDRSSELARYRDGLLFNPGASAAYISGVLDDIRRGTQRAEWVTL